jgi:hypothetical protein
MRLAMKTDDLIHQLAQNLKPVTSQMRPGRFVGMGLFVALIAILLGLAAFSVRSDFLVCCTNPLFIMDLLLSLTMLVGGLWLVAKLRNPTFHVQSWHKRGLIAVLLVDIGLHFSRMLSLGRYAWTQGLAIEGFSCSWSMMLAAALPIAFYLWQSRKGASTEPLQSGLFAAVAGWGAGGLMICIHCPVESSSHILLWHLLVPGALLIAMGIGLGRKFLRW